MNYRWRRKLGELDRHVTSLKTGFDRPYIPIQLACRESMESLESMATLKTLVGAGSQQAAKPDHFFMHFRSEPGLASLRGGCKPVCIPLAGDGAQFGVGFNFIETEAISVLAKNVQEQAF